MNCKPGELAFIVKSAAGNEGKIVRTVRFVGDLPWRVGNDLWEIDRNLPTTEGRHDHYMRDSYMRPIRDNDGEDETLTWAGKPEKVAA